MPIGTCWSFATERQQHISPSLKYSESGIAITSLTGGSILFVSKRYAGNTGTKASASTTDHQHQAWVWIPGFSWILGTWYQLHIKPSGRKVEHKSGKSTFFTISFWYPKKQHSCWYASTRIFLNLKPLQHPGCHMPGWADRTKHHWAPWCRLCLATGRCLVPSSFCRRLAARLCTRKAWFLRRLDQKQHVHLTWGLAGSNLYTQWDTNWRLRFREYDDLSSSSSACFICLHVAVMRSASVTSAVGAIGPVEEALPDPQKFSNIERT